MTVFLVEYYRGYKKAVIEDLGKLRGSITYESSILGLVCFNTSTTLIKMEHLRGIKGVKRVTKEQTRK